MGKTTRAALLLVLLACLARPARAGDGAIDWRTLSTEHVDVHYPRELEALARHVLAAHADARQTLLPLFNARSRPKLQITLDDFVDAANGFATPLPYDRVHLLAYPPPPGSDLGDHGDWVRALFFHEYAHILHLGDVSGIPAAANLVLGRRWLPNLLLPRFFVEGLATYVETRHTGGDTAVQGHGGRVDSPVWLGYLRAAVLDGAVPDLARLTGEPLRWPRGTGWYLYGSLLFDHVARRSGHDAIKTFMAVYGERIFAYGLQGTARQVWGASLSRLWLDTVAALRADVHGELRRATGADPATEAGLAQVAAGDGARLTRGSEWRGRLRPVPGQDAVVGAHGPPDGRTRIERIDLRTGRVETLHVCELDCDEPLVTPDGRWLLFTETWPVERVYRFREVRAVPLQGGPALRLTHGLRGRSPSLDPTGTRLLVVTVRAGRTQIRTLPLLPAIAAARQGRKPPATTLLLESATPGEVLDSPVLGGDGQLYFTVGVGGRRQLWSAPVDLAAGKAGPARLVLAHAHVRPGDPLLRQDAGAGQVPWLYDLQPFSRQGRPWLGAVVQVGRFRDAAELALDDVAAGWRLRTRTATGVTTAAHGEHRVATVRHHGHGLEVYRAPELADLPVALAAPATASADLAAPPTATGAPYLPPAIAAEPTWYFALPTLLPRSWTPIVVATGDTPDLLHGGLFLGASVFGQDALEHYTLHLSGQVRSDGTDPQLSASLAIRRWEPSWDLAFGYGQGASWLRRGWRWTTTPTDRYGLRLGGAWGLPRGRAAWSFDAAWRLVTTRLRDERWAIKAPHDPGGPPPVEPFEGRDGLFELGVGWGTGEAYPDSVLAERVHRYGGRIVLGHPSLGGQRRRVLLDARTTHHLPLGGHRVLVLDGNLSLAPLTGDDGPAYLVRGIAPATLEGLLGGGVAEGVSLVRGLGSVDALLGGNALLWSSAAVHLPLRDVGRGLDLLPAYAQRLWVVLYSDAAWAFGGSDDQRLPEGWVASLGAELRLGYELGYRPLGTLRLGAARAFGTVDGTQVYLTIGY